MDAQVQGNDEGSAVEVMYGLGIPDESKEGNTSSDEGDGETDLPKGVKERLGRQEKRHQREMRQLREQLDSFRSQVSSPNTESLQEQSANPYSNQPTNGGGVDEQIQKAVSYALHHKEMQERKAKDLQEASHIHKKYQALQDDLDKTSDKYEDFDKLVRADDAPFTNQMRDTAALFIKNPGEVLYKLAKNPEELRRISKLPKVDQAREMIELSHALRGENDKSVSSPKILGQIKSNPVTSSPAVTEKTSISDLRARMKAGWK